jgi:hypothetical protein
MEVDANMKKFFIVLLYILGFPALIGLIAYNSIDMIKGGISYGVFVFVGIIIVVVFALLYFAVVGIMAKNASRKGKKNIYHQTFVAMLLSFCLLGGFWMLIDVAIPDLLADATSNTLYYEDLADNYYARSIVNEELLDEYISRNVANGNLQSKTLEQYQAEGVNNEEVAMLMAIQYNSIDLAGYQTFTGPWIDLALGDRMTIPVLVHLLLDEREVPDLEYYLYNYTTEEVCTDPVYWNVLDMLGTTMEIDTGMQEVADYDMVISLISNKLSELIADPDILGSPIYIDVDGTVVTLTPSNELRGVLDYQSMAWLYQNGAIYAIVMLFSTRKYFLIFAGWLVISNFFIGMLRGMGDELKQKNARPMMANGRYPNNRYPNPNAYANNNPYQPQRMPNRGMYPNYPPEVNMRHDMIQNSRAGLEKRYNIKDYR